MKFTNQNPNQLIDKEHNPIFKTFKESERIIKYKKLMSEDIEEKDLKGIRLSIEGKSYYMSEKFKKQIAALLPKKRRRGRPQKNLTVNTSNETTC